MLSLRCKRVPMWQAVRFSPSPTNRGRSSMVECDLAKVVTSSSILPGRSNSPEKLT